MALECLVGGGGSDTIIMSGQGDLMAAGGNGADVFRFAYGSGGDTCIVWGGGGADQIRATPSEGAGSLGIMVATVAGLTAANFHLFDKSMLSISSSFDWSLIDVLILNPDAGDRIVLDDYAGENILLSVVQQPQDIQSTATGPDGELVTIETVNFMADPVSPDYTTPAGHYEQTFVGGYSGTVFTAGTAIEDYLIIEEYRDPYEDFIFASNYAGHPLGDGLGLLGDGWDGEVDTIHDLGSAKYSSDWIETGPGYFVRAHYFEQLHEGPIDHPGNWFIAGGGLEGTRITGAGAIHADMSGVTDERLSDWLLAA